MVATLVMPRTMLIILEYFDLKKLSISKKTKKPVNGKMAGYILKAAMNSP